MVGSIVLEKQIFCVWYFHNFGIGSIIIYTAHETKDSINYHSNFVCVGIRKTKQKINNSLVFNDSGYILQNQCNATLTLTHLSNQFQKTQFHAASYVT